MQDNIHISSACCLTSDCLKKIHFLGSTPEANKQAAVVDTKSLNLVGAFADSFFELFSFANFI